MKKIEIDYQSENSFRAKAVLWLLEQSVPIHARLNKGREAWNLTSKDFLNHSYNTLGNALGQFYTKHKFEPIAKAERHDVFHVLLNYSTCVVDEAAMQFFLLGNGKPSLFTTGTCVLTALLYPDKLNYFLKSYQKGKNALSIKSWDFRLILNENLNQLQNKIFNSTNKPMKPLTKIRTAIVIFIVLLVLSGVTAFPLRMEMDFLIKHKTSFPDFMTTWIEKIYTAVNQTPDLILYGTDWLAFAHIIIALFFIPVYLDPQKHKANLIVAMIACCAVFPLAFICGPIRSIPFFHQLIDCSFGVFGMLPLLYVYTQINQLNKTTYEHTNKSFTPAR